VTFPANFTLIAAMNPCPCGYYGDPSHDCTCSPQTVGRYQRRISGPLLDRIDLFADVPRVDFEKLAAGTRAEPSAAVAERVRRARDRQRERFAESAAGTIVNSEMTPAEVRDLAQLRMSETASSLLKVAVERLSLSARAFHRTLKLARTIADLAESEGIEQAHVAEAIQYRERVE
jgi:magnesium chelatase family protein